MGDFADMAREQEEDQEFLLSQEEEEEISRPGLLRRMFTKILKRKSLARDPDLTWETRDGRIIYPRDFGNSHLLNTIKFMEKQAMEYRQRNLECFPSFNGEMAQLCAEREYYALQDSSPKELCMKQPIYRALCREAVRRGFMEGDYSEELY